MSEPTVGSARIDLHVAGEASKDDVARAVGVGERRPRKGALRPKPVREFTVYAAGEERVTKVRADAVSTLGDWFTLTLNGHEVFGAPREQVLQYTASEVAAEAA